MALSLPFMGRVAGVSETGGEMWVGVRSQRLSAVSPL
jgi:hypothetical protein